MFFSCFGVAFNPRLTCFLRIPPIQHGGAFIGGHGGKFIIGRHTSTIHACTGTCESGTFGKIGGVTLTLEECVGMSADELAKLANGHLWTASEADEELGVPQGTTAVWVARRHIEPGLTVAGIRYYWSNDLYDRKMTRKQPQERDDTGRFKAKKTPQ